MNHIDFTLILSSALTPITLISGVGLLLLTMSARYDHTTARVRQLLHADEMTGGTDPHLAEAIELIFHRAELLRKAILFVVLSAACFSALTIIKHAENIKRIFKGEEKPLKIKRFTFKKKGSK